MKRPVLLILVCAQAVISTGCPWDKDMVDQPSPKPQESPAPPEPPDSIPVGGTEFVPAPASEAEAFDGKDAAAAIANPVPATADSIATGHSLYEVNCLVCHGREGQGDGPVGLKFVDPTPVDLNEEYTQEQADGQLFYTITRGRVAMPFYRDALSIEERWHVVNYVKTEFGNGLENEPATEPESQPEEEAASP